jgi:hypothetical protein
LPQAHGTSRKLPGNTFIASSEIEAMIGTISSRSSPATPAANGGVLMKLGKMDLRADGQREQPQSDRGDAGQH